MPDPKAGYWYLVKMDVLGPEWVDELNNWYDRDHINDHLAVDGINHAWRTRECEAPGAVGDRQQEFWAIYQCDDTAPFGMKWVLANGRPTPPPQYTADGTKIVIVEGQRHAKNSGKVLYRVPRVIEGDQGSGAFWVRYEFDWAGPEELRADFEEFVADNFCARLPGQAHAHRAWLIRAEPNKFQTIPHPPGEYIVVAEVDEAASLAEVASSAGVLATAPGGPVELRGLRAASLIFEMPAAECEPERATEWIVLPAE
jgi:hypothetical protein